MSDPASPSSLAARLGLHRPELRAWAMYDWANSAFMTVVVSGIYPVYYEKVAAAGLANETALYRYSLATTLALAITAVISPVLGAVADYGGIKKRMLLLFQTIAVVFTAAMYWVGPGAWKLALWLLVLTNIGAAGAFTFYDSLLPHVARGDELDRVSTAGYALGYLGGGLLMAVNLLWIQQPGWFGFADASVATRVSFVSVAVWWVVFSIPLYRRVPEPPRLIERDERLGENMLAAGFGRLGETFRELRKYRQALLLLIASLLYTDGINTIIRMAGPYASQIGIPGEHITLAILLVQFVGVPFAFLFGRLAAHITAKRAVFISIAVYTLVSVIGYYMQATWQFYLLALLVGMVQGGSQALSRSLFALMIPRHKSSEFFGFWGVFEKFAGVLGPLLFAVAIDRTGSTRAAILSIILFFVIGAALLALVDVPVGERVAREAERSAHAAGA